jgi:hypothetical protein
VGLCLWTTAREMSAVHQMFDLVRPPQQGVSLYLEPSITSGLVCVHEADIHAC